MIRIAFPLVLVIALVGCAQTYTWVKPGASSTEFYRAKSNCEARASGATPMDYSNPGSSTTVYSGSVYGDDGGYGNYSGSSTTYNDNTAQTFANLGQAMRRQRLFNDCMRGQGFSPQEEQAVSSSKKSEAEGIGSPYSERNSTVRDKTDWEDLPVDVGKGTVNFVNTTLLSRPDFNAEKLVEIAKGEEVVILGQTENFWYKVQYKWQQGYVLQPWVTPINDEPPIQ